MRILKSSILIGLLGILVSAAQAQHTVRLELVDPPIPENEVFTVSMVMDSAHTGIVGFSFRILYDQTQFSLTSVTDNTGQPQAAIVYTMGFEVPVTGVPGVDTRRILNSDTAADITAPTNLGLLNFTKTPGFNVAPEDLVVIIESHSNEASAGGLIDNNFQFIPTDYESLFGWSSVSDWNLY